MEESIIEKLTENLRTSEVKLTEMEEKSRTLETKVIYMFYCYENLSCMEREVAESSRTLEDKIITILMHRNRII